MSTPDLTNDLAALARIEPGIAGMIHAIQAGADAGEQPITIAACGVMNAGKSTLLNCLTGHIEEEYFKSAAIRETLENKSFAAGAVCYLDTPGFDGAEGDDATALAGLHQADVILFVHNLEAGELKIQGTALLRGIARITTGSHLAERLVVVLTHPEQGEAAEVVAAKVEWQVREELGIAPRCFRVSSTSYRRGRLQGKPALEEFSGLPALQAHIDTQLRHLQQAVAQARGEQLAMRKAELKAAVAAALVARREQIQALARPHVAAMGAFCDAIQALREETRQRLAVFAAIQ